MNYTYHDIHDLLSGCLYSIDISSETIGESVLDNLYFIDNRFNKLSPKISTLIEHIDLCLNKITYDLRKGI